MGRKPERPHLKASQRMRLALAPPPNESEHDTGLRFTDILFGFVISQIFLRLQNWGELQGFVRWQLIVSTIIVLGSWIGFRRSLNRQTYELKFFNLPLLRFILDQAMVLLYFRIATLTPSDPAKVVDPSSLASDTLEALFLVFALYALWDIGGLLMSWGWTSSASKYRKMSADWTGLTITAIFLASIGALLYVDREIHVGASQASLLFAGAAIALLAYRWAKDVRSTWRQAVETSSTSLEA
jgi:hypothetical protein